VGFVTVQRRLPCGVEVQPGGIHARVWAPAVRSVDIVLLRGDRRIPLTREADGHFSAWVADAGHGDRYWFALEGDRLRPDPCSRLQPEGPHGPSQVVDPDRFTWTDDRWPGVSRENNVLYEMHVGTFTAEGTWRAAMAQLPRLADLGITVIEMMPVAEFAGRFGWGYDGVDLYAPTHLYGDPDDLRAFVDRAHALGLGVILDVVYNHLGPDGNYLSDFSPDYFTNKYSNDWGAAINFEGPPPAREFFVANAGYWIDEFHFDGLRFDATQDMKDASEPHVLADMASHVRRLAAPRTVLLVGENEPQDARLVKEPSAGGYGLDSLWNDDFHHTAVTALTGRREAYYHDYKGSPQELISCAKYGFLYQGQYYPWQKGLRGTPAIGLPKRAFVTFLENHDQVANSAFGRRLNQVAGPGRLRALTALLLLGPGQPMLFQGQEYWSTVPFLYFADHKEELRTPITEGRREFLRQFNNIKDPEVEGRLPQPLDAETFTRAKLDVAERERNVEALTLHRELITLRREDPVLAAGVVDGAVLGPEVLMLRYFGGDDGDRLLILNLGCDLDLLPIPEPLMAPPPGCEWVLRWSSESVRYGGQGTAPIHPDREWHVPGETAVVLTSRERTSAPRTPDPATRNPDPAPRA
jgi:maltooligosyltrehalose trehalohydrolase